MILLYLIITALITLINRTTAVPLDLVDIACARDPTLPFCDSHLLGLPTSSTTTTRAPTRSTFSPEHRNATSMGTGEQQDQFFTWLEEYKDQKPVDDDEDDVGPTGDSPAVSHGDPDAYCSKYKSNFNNYCSGDRGEELEGVLAQFCSAYRRGCHVGAGIDEDFPQPPESLDHGFHLSKNPIEETEKGESMEKEEMQTTPKPETKVEEKMFSGTAPEYCKKFLSHFDDLCTDANFRAEGESAEFCASFKENCQTGGAATKKKTSSSSDEEDLEELPPDDEPEEQQSKVEGAGSDSNAAVMEYCEKYSENYNYFCAGDATEENKKFCTSYEKNCPQKVGS